MNTVIWIIYTAVSLAAIIFLSLREFHMLQLNGYKTPEHSRWMKKNFRRYIFPLVLLIAQFGLIPLTGGGRTALLITLCVMDLFIILANKPGKKFKKPLVYTARVKRMMTTFFILVALIIAGSSFFWSLDLKKPWIYLFTGSALYLTPILVPLSNLINKPIEKAVQNWYINDAKKKLGSMPSLHTVGITGSYGKTSMKFYLSELLSSKYETLKTPESFNTPMGVTITVRRDLKPTHEYFICEMGARRVHEIKELCGIAHPNDGIITSVGPSAP